ncbi:hypothetical protein KGQ20_46465, partial [Catenulispora sp. NF23]
AAGLVSRAGAVFGGAFAAMLVLAGAAVVALGFAAVSLPIGIGSAAGLVSPTGVVVGAAFAAVPASPADAAFASVVVVLSAVKCVLPKSVQPMDPQPAQPVSSVGSHSEPTKFPM